MQTVDALTVINIVDKETMDFIKHLGITEESSLALQLYKQASLITRRIAEYAVAVNSKQKS